MSWVTNIMVSAHREGRSTAGEFAAWLTDKPYEYLQRESWHRDLPYPWPEDREWEGPYVGGLAETPASVWPGTKVHECHVWLGVLNTADLDKVRERFAAMRWQMPNAVQLMMMDQEETFFRIWMLRDGRLYEVPMPPPYEEDDRILARMTAWMRDSGIGRASERRHRIVRYAVSLRRHEPRGANPAAG